MSNEPPRSVEQAAAARLLAAVSAFVVAHPRRILVGAALVSLAAAALLPRLEIQAGHSSMFDKSDVHQARFAAFQKRFGSPNVLFLVVKGGTTELRREAIDKLGARLPAGQQTKRGASGACDSDGPPNHAGCVGDFIGRVDIERYMRHGMLYLPLDKLRELVAFLGDEKLGLRRVLQLEDLAGVVGLIADAIEHQMETGNPDAVKQKEAAAGTQLLARFFDEVTHRLTGKKRSGQPFEEALIDREQLQAAAGIDPAGYFTSRDGSLAVALVRPVDDSDEPDIVVPFVKYVRRHVQQVVEQLNSSKAKSASAPLAVTITGLPALIADEREVLSRDLPLTSAVAAVGILLLFVFAFRSLRQGVLGMLPLLAALLCTLGFVVLFIGGLNMVTAACIPTMLGLGIDFFVHLLARYNEARHDESLPAKQAVQRAIEGAGPGILTGALTTSGAFFALAINRFKGFSDLGIITAVGLIFSLLALLVTAAVLASDGKLARFLQQPPRRRSSTPRVSWLVRWRHGIVAGGLLLTGLMLWQAPGIPWSYNYLALLPSDRPSVTGMLELAKRTDFSGEIAALQAGSISEAKRLVAELSKRPTVGRIESLASYIPQQQKEKIALLRKLAPLAEIEPAWRARGEEKAIDSAPLAQQLERLADNLEDARFDAKRASHPAAKQLAAPIEAVSRLREALAKTPASVCGRRLAGLERLLFDKLDHGLKLLRANVQAHELTVERLVGSLPPGVAQRMVSREHFALYVYPRSSVWDGDMLPRFVADVRSVQRDATGFTVTHWEANVIIQRGFRDASMLAVGVLLVLLLLDFRSLRYALAALVPLAMGVAWMLGAMHLLSMSYNFANIIAFPLIIGIGVASGVHILHRFKQEGGRDVGRVVRHTGLAIVLSALTTMVGFGSLILAQHRGAAALGLLLLLGVGACLVTATLFLPAILALRSTQQNKNSN